VGRWLEALFFKYSDCVRGPLKPVISTAFRGTAAPTAPRSVTSMWPGKEPLLGTLRTG
jgi:hypothetical protein